MRSWPDRLRSVRRLALLALAVGAGTLALAASARALTIPWCGTGEPTTDQPDAVSAYEWHVLYALPDGSPDRFAAFASHFTGDAAAASAWWVGQDSTRRPRYDLIDAPSCGNEFGRLDISLVHVPAGITDYDGIVNAIRAAGFQSPDKGYLVYFDGTPHAGDEYGLCGLGANDNVAFAYSIVFLQTCGQESSDDFRAMVATHEMAHGMGAVPDEAPHVCDNGHVCDSPNDLMKAVADPGDSLATAVLDVGHDDYYDHPGSWWDMRNSSLLYDLDQSLAPAPTIVNLTATDDSGGIRVDWEPSASVDGLYYRIYDGQGNLVNDGQYATELTAIGTLGQVFTWTIRAATQTGFLSPPATLHYKVGYGIVDASGALLKDTVDPAPVTHLHVTYAAAKVVLRWAKVGDPIGLRGYRVTVPGLKPLVVTGTTASFPRVRVRGKTVSVAAVDRSGNVGGAATARVR